MQKHQREKMLQQRLLKGNDTKEGNKPLHFSEINTSYHSEYETLSDFDKRYVSQQSDESDQAILSKQRSL
jgi:hypothetical protein